MLNGSKPLPCPPMRDGSTAADKAVPHLTALRADHLLQAVGLSSALGWPYREADWRFAFGLGAGFAAEVDGRLLGTALWWAYGESHASVGMIIVAADMQGQGLGRALMGELSHATRGRTVILNSTVEGLPLYAQLGFVPQGQVFQHQAMLAAPPRFNGGAGGVRAMTAGDEAQVRALDLEATGMDRRSLLSALFDAGTTLVVDRGAGVSAYACAREFGRGVVIGPVAARGPEAEPDAMRLIAALASAHHSRFVRIDVTGHSGLSVWLAEIGLPCVGHAQPMVLRGAPAQPPASCVAEDAHAAARLFALSNQSFG